MDASVKPACNADSATIATYHSKFVFVCNLVCSRTDFANTVVKDCLLGGVLAIQRYERVI